MSHETRTETTENQRKSSEGPGPDPRKGPGPELMSAHSLLGNDVYNRQSESLGAIKEIMIDVRSGRVAYAVMTFGGFLGMGSKLFAVPWEALTLDTKEHHFTLNVDKTQLEGAPGFDRSHWPDMADPIWAQAVHDYYGTEPHGSDPRV